jgi:hypothetical protein
MLLSSFLLCSSIFAQPDGDNTNFVLKSTSHEFGNFWQNDNGGIRGLVAGTDLDNDGLYEIIASDYDDGGKVHVFEIVGDNQLQWVWSSPGIGTEAQTTCRYVAVADLDGNGRQEILLSISESADNPSSSAGIHVYEWTGQNNGYGSQPVALTRGRVSISQFRCDSFLAKDIDKDGKEELVLALNGLADQDYFVVLSVTGTFESGSITWLKEAQFKKGEDFEGDAVNVVSSDMDGDGNLEILAHSALNMMLLPIEVTGPNQYAFGTAFMMNDSSISDVNLVNGVAVDIDGDGRDEVYYNGWKTGNLYMLGSSGDALNLNASHVNLISQGGAGAPFVSFGMANGDQDHGVRPDNPDLYIGAAGYTADLFNLEYTGGDVKDPSNYQWYTIYHDSTDGGAIATRVLAPPVDLDKDGSREIVLGYQSIPDTVDSQAVEKHWLRILEYDLATSIGNEQDWTVTVPSEMFLVENYPNPFSSQTTFSLSLRTDGLLRGSIYNILGQRVATVMPESWRQSGEHASLWNGMDDHGQALSNGVYFARFELNGFAVTKRIMLNK